jgi:hypothetical protein
MTIKAYNGVEIEHIVKKAVEQSGVGYNSEQQIAAATLLVALDIRRLLDKFDSRTERQLGALDDKMEEVQKEIDSGYDIRNRVLNALDIDPS